MKKNLLSGILLAGLFSLGVNAQQWSGAANTTGDITRMGKVGIYTSTPTQALEVLGSGYAKFGTALIGGYGAPMISFNVNQTYDANNSPTNRVRVGTGYAADLYFDYTAGILYYRNTATTTTPIDNDLQYPFSIQKSGLVTIGSINVPANVSCNAFNKLYVDGAVAAREVKVSLTNWCDYVFEKNYNLKSLKEVDAYIQANKHLPEVPSEKEVVANGVAMGEMMKIHMKKIEELTLYMIELQKQNEKLAAEVATLKK